ncbi:N-acetyltransferase B complex non catalytic subunit-domain-containing protein [Nemania abortiva]|nr:N-acetyltransferase B complex non catalytic subunit-domain-containing protein [Nemania abortiva]
MTPPRIPPMPRAVQLKHSVDLQLDHAFHEEQWTTAANLARQRHKATKDDYYRAVEIAAKSRGDNAMDRTTGIEAVLAMVNDNVIIKDVDALDLYEFAIDGFSMDYARTIGVLRARLAKALPKDKTVGARCLDACMWHSDWENAQEIAVSLNKNFPGDRKLLFQSILTTFLVAIDDSTHGMKKNLFPNLVKAQVDRAFNLRPPTGKEQAPLGQTDINENEIKLWLQIREKFGSAQENLKLLSLPNWGPLYFLEHGFTDAFLLSVRLLTFNQQWEAIIRVSDAIFDKVIVMGGKNPPAMEASDHGDRIDESPSSSQPVSDGLIREQYMNVSREWLLWISTITAIRNLPDGQDALDVFDRKLKKVVCTLISNNRMKPIFQQNYNRLAVDISFARAAITTGSPNSKLGDSKIQQLVQLSIEHIKDSNCFTMLKGYLELLDREELANFGRALDTDSISFVRELEVPNQFDMLLQCSLKARVRFLEATSFTAGEVCRFCCAVVKDGPDCRTCLQDITKIALNHFYLGVRDTYVSQRVAETTEDPLSVLALVGSICLVKLSGVNRETWRYTNKTPLHIDIKLFLQAVVWLDFYLKRTPKNDSLRLLLVKLYLMMGCATQALQVWKLFDVKNTLLECLGTVCLDRLASMSPSHFATGPSHRSYAEPFIRHFETAIQKRYPEAVVKTLQNSSYAEVTNLVELAQNQSRNCVIVLASVEHRRGIRLRNGRNETAIEDESLIGPSSSNYEFQDFTDYNPLPHWSGPQSTPIQELAACGPPPSNRRCHLSILAERFLDLVCFTQPKDFKPSQATQLLQVDWQATASSCQALHMELGALMYGTGSDEDGLTDPESWYFRTVTELAKLVKLVYEAVFLASSTKSTKEDVLAIIRRTLSIVDYQIQDLLAVPDGTPAQMHTFYGITALHATGMLRESSLAVKCTVQHITTALDRLKSIDKTRGAGEAAWLSPEIKKLSAAATAADVRMKDHIKKLTKDLHASGWIDRLVGWAFSDDEPIHGTDVEFAKYIDQQLTGFIPEDARENWAMDIAESWRDAVKGWGAVRFE